MQAQALKKEGNAAHQSRNYREAISKYKEALALNPKDHILFSNLAASYFRLCEGTGNKELAESAEFCASISITLDGVCCRPLEIAFY